MTSIEIKLTVERLAKSGGIVRNSHRWIDYEAIKRKIRNIGLTPDEYRMAVQAAAKYVGV